MILECERLSHRPVIQILLISTLATFAIATSIAGRPNPAARIGGFPHQSSSVAMPGDHDAANRDRRSGGRS
ncbi:hypothetical protein Y590_00450 [Methylobacterium sp. AMS5]|nr:hypothetical protein Y590_00450 [Methylobacterium sp. AMS5]